MCKWRFNSMKRIFLLVIVATAAPALNASLFNSMTRIFSASTMRALRSPFLCRAFSTHRNNLTEEHIAKIVTKMEKQTHELVNCSRGGFCQKFIDPDTISFNQQHADYSAAKLRCLFGCTFIGTEWGQIFTMRKVQK